MDFGVGWDVCNFDLVTDDLSGPTTNHSINFLFLGLWVLFFLFWWGLKKIGEYGEFNWIDDEILFTQWNGFYFSFFVVGKKIKLMVMIGGWWRIESNITLMEWMIAWITFPFLFYICRTRSLYFISSTFIIDSQ